MSTLFSPQSPRIKEEPIDQDDVIQIIENSASNSQLVKHESSSDSNLEKQEIDSTADVESTATEPAPYDDLAYDENTYGVSIDFFLQEQCLIDVFHSLKVLGKVCTKSRCNSLVILAITAAA